MCWAVSLLQDSSDGLHNWDRSISRCGHDGVRKPPGRTDAETRLDSCCDRRCKGESWKRQSRSDEDVA